MNNPNKDLVQHLRWLADKIENKKIALRQYEVTRNPYLHSGPDVITWEEQLDLRVEVHNSEYEG